MFTKGLLIILSCGICLSTCYTIIGGQADMFPSQKAIDKKSFLRMDPRHGVQFLSCPNEFIFDEKQLKCVYTAEAAKGNIDKFCPEDLKGTLPYKNNCRLYVSCWDGRGAIQECGLNLLYNEDIGHCDYPERANCCEFRSKSQSVLV